MLAKSLFKVFGLALLTQVILLGLCIVVPGLGDLLMMSVYWPWINLAITWSGAKGESSMIWPPVYGLILGVLIYSLAAAVLFACFGVLRSRMTQSRGRN